MRSERRELTPREREVAEALGRGERQADIARRLDLSVNTVAQFVIRIKDRLGLYATRQIGEYARAQGWC